MNMTNKFSRIGMAIIMVGIAFAAYYPLSAGNVVVVEATTTTSTSTSVSTSTSATGSALATALSNAVATSSSTNNSTNISTSPKECANGTTLTLTEVRTQKTKGKITFSFYLNPTTDKIQTTVVNNTQCSFPVSQITYRMFDSKLSTQEFFSETGTITIDPRSQKVLFNSLPTCLAQNDVYYGAGPHQLYDDNRYGAQTLAWTLSQKVGGVYATKGSNYCGNPTPIPGKLKIVKTVINDNGGTKQVSDFALYIENTRVTSGQVLTLPPNSYFVHEDNLSGYQAGTWGGDCTSLGQVFVVSGQEKTCTITNNDIPPTTGGGGSSFNGTCSALPATVNINEPVTYRASPTGGTGVYTYTWSGDGVSGTGSTTSTIYGAQGTKTATLIISSGSESITRNCSVTVLAPNGGGGGGGGGSSSFTAYCSANRESGLVGDMITWTGSASGGNGSYSYSWSGTDNLSGTNSTVQKAYSTTGQKSATLLVTSNGQMVSQTCSVAINPPTTGGGGGSTSGGSGYVNPTQYPYLSGVYLSQLPYTGIGDNFKVAFFILALLAWSGFISYLLIKRKAAKASLAYAGEIGIIPTTRPVALMSRFMVHTSKAHNSIPVVANMAHEGITVTPHQTKIERKIAAPLFVAPTRESYAPSNIPTHTTYEDIYNRINGTPAKEVKQENVIEKLEVQARALNTLVSAEGLSLIAEASNNDLSLAQKTLNYLVKLYHTSAKTDDQWSVLNTDMIKKIVAQEMSATSVQS